MANPIQVSGAWRLGWTLDVHTTASVFLGYDQNGRAQFDTTRSELGELLYPSRRFEKAEIMEYLAVCRRKALETLAAETRESLERESGFPRLPFSRGELHVYNIRHLQHHTGQLSAFLRRIDDPRDPKWVKTGWR